VDTEARERLDALEAKLAALEGEVENRINPVWVPQLSGFEATDIDGFDEAVGRIGGRIDQITKTVETVKAKAESATATASGVVAKVEAAKAAAEKVGGLATKIHDLREDAQLTRIRQHERAERLWGWLQGIGWATGGIGACLIGGAFVLWRQIKRVKASCLTASKVWPATQTHKFSRKVTGGEK